jgi:16S rRNA (uracil1498-N3)-methyltransferase
VERDDLASLAGFFSGDGPLAAGTNAVLGEEAAHHARVRRLEMGERVYVADGVGGQGVGRITSLAKNQIQIAIDDVIHVQREQHIHLLVPIADRDRMLWCAEKCTELGATSWRPIVWNRSRSVSPRGEGAAFREKVGARMRSALVQAHAPWLPDVADDASLDRALEGLPSGGTRLALDAAGEPISGVRMTAPVSIAIGPEGGLEPAELQRLRDARFRLVSLGANVLRFETAAVAALAIVRAAVAASPETTNG